MSSFIAALLKSRKDSDPRPESTTTSKIELTITQRRKLKTAPRLYKPAPPVKFTGNEKERKEQKFMLTLGVLAGLRAMPKISDTEKSDQRQHNNHNNKNDGRPDDDDADGNNNDRKSKKVTAESVVDDDED
ncbi:hypothetical protein BT63DRAFT_171644 [Microthyrium microscopicum]|uniref:Uncharacterized protein n=1 Tax=Microthyrium microscopicum TaxID=703497 RepID=A0A6A6UQ92_9PEZI|nr:hypothetical protein BT63DRAFT_171644 [Microthyrium microscopicum]